MSPFARTSAAATVACLVVAGAPPGLAASPSTQTFMAHVMQNVDFLDRSSRFALENSKDHRLKAFAWSEAREQTLAANALYDWTQADANPLLASTAGASLDQTPTGSTKPAPAAPPVPADPNAAPPPVPLGQEDLDSLEGLEGKDFDAQYKDKQREALQQVEADYAAYAATGDDPALKTLAARELPKVAARLKALGKI